jgi:predicted phage tail protein
VDEFAEAIKEGLRDLKEEVRSMKLAQEQLRRDFAVGFVPRDVLDLRLQTMAAQMQALDTKMETIKRELAKEIDDLRSDVAEEKKQAIGKAERHWMQAGTISGIVGVIVAILSYLYSIKLI